MRNEDTAVSATTGHLDAAHDKLLEFQMLDHLAAHTDDPDLRRELGSSIAGGQAATGRFRAARDRLWMGFVFGR